MMFVTLCLAGFSVFLFFCMFFFFLIPCIVSKHNVFVSISSVVCSYLSCSALATQTLLKNVIAH